MFSASGIRSSTLRAGAPTTSIALSRPMRSRTWLRTWISLVASSSVRPPAATAAATSPKLCPMTNSGRTPCAVQYAESPSWSPNSAGIAYCERWSWEACSVASSVSRTDQPASAWNLCSNAWNASPNAASSSSRRRPMAHHCPPCPP